MASSPRTAYWASRTFWFMLLILRLRTEFVVDMVRAVPGDEASEKGRLGSIAGR